MDAIIGAIVMSILLAVQFTVALIVAGVTYPFALLKKTEPPKYFSLEMMVNIDGKSTDLHYVWHCENKRKFTGNNGWEVTWERSANTMVSKLPDGSTVFIPLPQSCDLKDSQEYLPNVSRVRDQSNPDEIELYPGKEAAQDYGVSDAIKSGTIRVLDREIPDAALSQGSALLLKAVSDEKQHYCAVVVNTYPKNEWGKFWNLDQPERFERLEKFTTSTELSNISTPSERLGINRFAWEKGVGLSNLRMAYVRSIPLRATNLRKVNNVWLVDSNQDSNQFLKLNKNDCLYALQADHRNEQLINISYKGHSFVQKGMIEQLYDPETKDILEFRIIRHNVVGF